MAVSVNPVDGATYFGVKAAKAKSELNMETFMRLLTVQLSNQNPLEPMNDRDFFAQMAQLGQVQGMDKLNDTTELERAQSLFGMRVSGVRTTSDADGTRASMVDGIVKGVSTRNGVTWLQVEEANGGITDMQLSSIQSVKTVEMTQGQDLLGKLVTIEQPDGSAVSGIVRNTFEREGKTMIAMETTDGKMVEGLLSSVRVARQATDMASLGSLLGQDVTGPAKVSITDSEGHISTLSKVITGQVDKVALENGIAKAYVITAEYGTVKVNVAELTAVARPSTQP